MWDLLGGLGQGIGGRHVFNFKIFWTNVARDNVNTIIISRFHTAEYGLLGCFLGALLYDWFTVALQVVL